MLLQSKTSPRQGGQGGQQQNVNSPSEKAGGTEEKKPKGPPKANERENSLINRSIKASTDEVFNSIVKSRHQLVNFEQDELKFMANLKMKALKGMASI